MPARKHIQPGEKVSLKLTAPQRKLILEDVSAIDQDYETIIRETPPDKPVMMTLDDLDDFAGYIAAEANHCDDANKQNRLDTIYQKVERLLDAYTDEPPQTFSIEDAQKEQMLADQAGRIAEYAAMALSAAELMGMKTKPLEPFWLAPAQREVLQLVPGIPKAIKAKLAKGTSTFTVTEVATMTMHLAEDLLDGDARKQVAVLVVAQHLMERLREGIMAKVEPPAGDDRDHALDPDAVFQFKITLVGSEPTIWRRIQVRDCTLDDLHEHIQAAMGWTNSHLHQFEIEGERYGDPVLLNDGFDDMQCIDSTATVLSQILPKGRKRFAFMYEYDFGDGWQHEILFEGRPKVEKRKRYPVCLEGERACPPEDVGGVWGFAEYLAALADPKHECHEQFVEWGGGFDPDKFDPKQATRAMKQGLAD